MSDQNSDQPARQRLLPHQRGFVDHYFNTSDIKLHLLVAPTGSGATTTVIEVARRLAEQEGGKKILILTESRALLSQFVYMLRESGFTPTLVDRYKYRELEDSGHFTSSPWASPGLYLSTVQFVVQRDIREGLFSTGWDLLIYDAPHRSGTRNTEFLNQFLARPELSSAIILSNRSDAPDRDALPPRTSVTEWNPGGLLDWNHKPLWRRGDASVEAVLFKLSESEIASRDAVAAIVAMAGEAMGNDAAKEQITSIFSSYDPYSTEIRLRSFYSQLKDHRNLVAHGRKGEDRFIDDLSVIENLLRRIEVVLELFESQETDHKLEAVVGRLMQTSAQNQRIVITTFSIATGQYLASSLEPFFKHVHAISSAVAPADVERAIQDFRSSGGLLISSIAMLEGLDLRDTDILVPYDPPKTAHNAVTLLGRFVRIGRSTPLRILVPVDDHNASTGQVSGLTLIEEALSTLCAT